MSVILEVAAGYLVGRFIAYHGSLLAQVIVRRIVLLAMVRRA